MVKFESYKIEEMSNFIWDGFTDPAAVGVNLENVLKGAKLVGVDLTDEQIASVIRHSENVDEWNENDEKVRDLIADATDYLDYNKMFDWLTFIVGDTTAEELVKNWENEAQSIVDRFDRVNDCHTQTVKAWKDTFNEELKETEDEDERDSIEAATALLEDLEDNELAINYVDPIDFVILPYGATTNEEKRLCQSLALN